MHPGPQRGDDDLRRIPGLAGRPGVLAGGAGGSVREPGRVVDRLGVGFYGVDYAAAALRATRRSTWRRPQRCFERYGDPVVFFSRMLPVMRTFISLPAGMARMPFVRFSVLTFLGCLPWCIFLVAIGDIAGSQLEALGAAAARARLPVIVRWWFSRAGGYCDEGAGSRTRFRAVPVPLMDIHGQYADLLPEIKQLVCDVIDSGRFILGPNVRAFEEEIAATIGYGHAVAVANGTDALVLALQALGVGRGDEVITTPYTFFATAEAIARMGATPVFADIDPDTLLPRPGRRRGGDHRAHAGDHARAHLRPARRPAGLPRPRRPPRPGADRGRRAGVRRDRRRRTRPDRSATSRPSRSSPPRTCRRWATAAW